MYPNPQAYSLREHPSNLPPHSVPWLCELARVSFRYHFHVTRCTLQALHNHLSCVYWLPQNNPTPCFVPEPESMIVREPCGGPTPVWGSKGRGYTICDKTNNSLSKPRFCHAIARTRGRKTGGKDGNLDCGTCSLPAFSIIYPRLTPPTP